MAIALPTMIAPGPHGDFLEQACTPKRNNAAAGDLDEPLGPVLARRLRRPRWLVRLRPHYLGWDPIHTPTQSWSAAMVIVVEHRLVAELGEQEAGSH